MMRFERIVDDFRHLQLSGAVFVVGAYDGAVEATLHAFLEESAGAKHLFHRCLGGLAPSAVVGVLGLSRAHIQVVFERDIFPVGGFRRRPCPFPRRGPTRIGRVLSQDFAFAPGNPPRRPATIAYPRSEERRVGKESRSRWSP